MKMNIDHPRPVHGLLLLTGAVALPVSLQAAPLFSEPFDSQASAKVVVNAQANTGFFYVDYASFVRNQTGGGGPVTVSIPEAPNRIPGSAARRGVVLNATYAGTARAINLLAADAPGGTKQVFSGNYKMACDMWLAVDKSATAGTTEIGLFGVGHSGNNVISYVGRNSGIGTFGWASAEGGIAASTGDLTMNIAGTAAFRRENLADAALFSLAFPQGTALANCPNNQWTRVEMVVIGTKVSLYMNGVKMGEGDPAITSGFASIGYEDPFTGSTPGGLNNQFGLFDNFTVDSLPGPASIGAAPVSTFAKVEFAGQTPSAEFSLTNLSETTAYDITGATIDGTNAADFTVATDFPRTIPLLGADSVVVNFDPSTPNGLKVARLKLTTTDPNQPEIYLPLQARRAINSIEAGISQRVVSVSAVGGTGTGLLTFTNNGTSATTVLSPVISGTDAALFSVTGTFPLVIPPGDAVTLPIVFTPTGAKGLKTATLDFATDDAGVPTLSVVVQARYAFGPPLLAHYKMDDTAGTTLVDFTAASPAAALQIREAPFGFAQPSLLPGGAGTSVRLTPADSSTTGNFAISGAAHLPNVSYSLWIKPEAKAGNRRILNRSSLFTLTGTIYSLYLTPTGQLNFEVNSTLAAQSADGAIPDDTIHHIGVTHSDVDGFGNVTATRTRLYIDGAMVGESVEPVSGFTDYNLNTTAEGLYIGSATSAGQGYVGLIDDLQIYSEELTPDQMSGLFTQPGKNAYELTPSDYRITSVQYDPGTGSVTLSWNSTPGAVYSVQESTTTSGFTDVANQTGITATGVSTSVTFTTSGGTRRFFQIRRN